MKKLAVVLLVFVTSGLFAEVDPQTFNNVVNSMLVFASFGTVFTTDASSQLTVADMRQEDENRDGYIFGRSQVNAFIDQYVVANVETRQIISFFLATDSGFPQYANSMGWKDYGNIGRFSNLKEQLINDFVLECQKIGLQIRNTATTIQISVPARQSGTQPQQPSGTQPAQITIVNNTGYTIWYVYISPSTESNWGSDRLGSNQTIRNGQSVTLNLPDPTVTQYDIRIKDSDGDTYTKKNVRVTANSRIVFTFDDFD